MQSDKTNKSEHEPARCAGSGELVRLLEDELRAENEYYKDRCRWCDGNGGQLGLADSTEDCSHCAGSGKEPNDGSQRRVPVAEVNQQENARTGTRSLH